MKSKVKFISCCTNAKRSSVVLLKISLEIGHIEQFLNRIITKRTPLIYNKLVSRLIVISLVFHPINSVFISAGVVVADLIVS